VIFWCPFIAEVSGAIAPENIYYRQPDFWISNFIGIAGLVFAALAFWEAKKAKRAALAAGKTVKIQTIVIELTEIAQQIESIDQELDFPFARDLLSQSSRRLRRQLAPIQNEDDVELPVTELFQLLEAAKKALHAVRPDNALTAQELEPQSVFYAMEGHFDALSSKLAELTGLLEKRTIEPH
jgi:hypothetical protein